MKTLYPLLVCLMWICLISCRKNEFNPPTRETGSLKVNIGVSLNINEVSNRLKSMRQTENFKVGIYRADDTEVMSFENASEMPDTIELEIGNYYVEAHSDNDLPAEFENPYYSGRSDVFTISSNVRKSVLVNCQLANTIVSLEYSDIVSNSFTDYSTTVSSELGSLVFLKNETRMGYFQTMPLEITVELTYQLPDGSDTLKILTGNIPDPLPNRHYELLVNTSVDDGMAGFQILLDSSLVQVEAVLLTDDSSNYPIGAIGYGELLITEIMFNPSALSDTEGEWFEIYNNSDRVVNLKNLILGRDDANRHIITDSIDLLPGGYFVFERADLSTDAVNSYLYGSDILLSNTGAVLALYNEGTETDPGELIFSVNYGGADFPDGTGASISLNPIIINASDAVQGTSWCTSTTVYNTGDFGTPGLINDSCL
jgi:hypothetical protein